MQKSEYQYQCCETVFYILQRSWANGISTVQLYERDLTMKPADIPQWMKKNHIQLHHQMKNSLTVNDCREGKLVFPWNEPLNSCQVVSLKGLNMWKILSGLSREKEAMEERVREGGKDTEEGGERREGCKYFVHLWKRINWLK